MIGENNQQKSRRQNSNTDKPISWNNNNLNNTGGSAGGVSSQSAQIQASRKQGASLGNRKTSLEQKFNHSNFTHHRQFSDISQQNLVGYKGIGTNLGVGGSITESGPSGVNLTSKLQNQQPTMNEHQSMPIMSTSIQAQRFLSNQVGSAASGQLSTGNQGDILTQIPSFIQR